MRILLLDEGHMCLDFALRCRNAGHEIKWFMKQDPSKPTHVGKGFPDLEIVKDWEGVLKTGWPDLVFLSDNAHYLKQLERYLGNFAIMAGPWQAAQLELDRDFGMKSLKERGVDVPSSVEFSNYDKAEEYVRQEFKKDPSRRFVSKPSGDADKSLSYVSKNAADMIVMLGRWKKFPKKNAKPFIIQKFVKGIEMAVGGWFGPHGFNRLVCENFEFKKLMNGDLGVSTGEQGTVIRYVDKKKSKLFQEVLQPCENLLKKLRYVGFVDLNCIIDDQGKPWPLEFTMRPGWPLFYIQTELHADDPAQWMLDLCEGRDTLRAFSNVCTGVVVTQPDYPYSKVTNKEVRGFPIWGIKSFKHFHPCEVEMGNGISCVDGKLVEGPSLLTSGDYIYVGCGQGKSVLDSYKQAYQLVKTIEMPNSISYRTDIGQRLKKQLPKLHDFGYAKGLNYE